MFDFHDNNSMDGGEGYDFMDGGASDDLLQCGDDDDYLDSLDTVVNNDNLDGDDDCFSCRGAVVVVSGPAVVTLVIL
jgi:hypothetical protein